MVSEMTTSYPPAAGNSNVQDLLGEGRRFGDVERESAMTDPHYWTFEEWLAETVSRIVTNGLNAPATDREGYLRVQIEAAIRQALRHGRSGRSDDDPVAS
jgi:hypothetical protein